MTPHYRGSFLALEKLRGNLDAIYDVTCVYSGSVNEKNERTSAPELIGKSFYFFKYCVCCINYMNRTFWQIFFSVRILKSIFILSVFLLKTCQSKKRFSRNGCMICSLSKTSKYPVTRWINNILIYNLTFSRIVSQFYRDGYLQKGVELKTVKNHSPLPYSATVPSFLFFMASFLPLVFFPELRLSWLLSILSCTVLGYLWLAVKSVC